MVRPPDPWLVGERLSDGTYTIRHDVLARVLLMPRHARLDELRGAVDYISLKAFEDVLQGVGEPEAAESEPGEVIAEPEVSLLYEPPAGSAELLIPDLRVVTKEAAEFLASHPEYMYELHHREFERMLDSVFRSLGYETELGPGSGDGGVDLRIVHKSEVGPVISLLQAKRYAADNPIDLNIVSALYGVVEKQRANKGILATTSRFLPSAQKFADETGQRLFLAGPDTIAKWLRDACRRWKV
jgi:hypothetical protein